jgi:hypothetical protein
MVRGLREDVSMRGERTLREEEFEYEYREAPRLADGESFFLLAKPTIPPIIIRIATITGISPIVVKEEIISPIMSQQVPYPIKASSPDITINHLIRLLIRKE